MKVWVVYDNKSYSPGVFGSKDMAFADALEIIAIHAKEWGYTEEEVSEAVNDLAKSKDCSEASTYLGELEVSIYERVVI
jgi:hypothetical protein